MACKVDTSDLRYLDLLELHITDVRMQCSLFDTLIRRPLSYGCEVWAVNAQLRNHTSIIREVAKHGVPIYGPA